MPTKVILLTGVPSLSRSSTVWLLDMSELALLLFGIILVAGLVGEYWLDHNPPPGLKPPSKRRKRLKRMFDVLVIAGVAGEILADGGIFGFGSHLEAISESEIKHLQTENGGLTRQLKAALDGERTNSLEVAELNVEASSNDLEIAALTSSNLNLSIELEKLRSPAIITDEQRKRFIDILCEPHNISKINIPVISAAASWQTKRFAYQISKILEEAGYAGQKSEYQLSMAEMPNNSPYVTNILAEVNLRPFRWDNARIIHLPRLNIEPLPVKPEAPFSIAYRPSSASQSTVEYRNEYPFTDNDPDVIALFSGTNAPDAMFGSAMIMYPSEINPSSDAVYFFLPTKDPDAILYGICEILHDMGITVGKNTASSQMPPGQIGLFIPDR